MITTPKLPPKPGYVEVEIGGVRKYKNAATGVLLEKEETAEPQPVVDPVEQLQTENKKLTAKIDTLTQSNQMLEDCVVEMAGIVYA